VPAFVGPDDAASDTEASRIEESADVVVVEDVPPDRLVIARLVRSGDSVQFDPSFVPARVRR
jgi:hypothetical protein